jgi:hypothetical protein
MIYTVKINDSLPSGKKLLEELRKHPKSVEFENQTLNDIVPKGYLTGDEFVERGKEKILKYYKENGLL